MGSIVRSSTTTREVEFVCIAFVQSDIILDVCSLSDPMPFDCVVKPRSEQTVKLIHDATAIHH